MKKIIAFLTVLILLLTCTFVSHAASLYFTKGEMIDSKTIANGVTWQKYKAISKTDSEGSFEGKQVVNVVTMAPNSVHFVTWTNPGINRTTPTNILDVIKQYEDANPNMIVVAAINGDYFDINGDYHMINAASVEGKVMKATTEEWFYSIGLKDDGTYKLNSRGDAISVTDEYYLNIYDFNRVNIVKQIKLDGFNEISQEGTSFIHKAKAREIEGGAAYAISASQLTKYDGVTYYKGLVNKMTDTLSLENETIVTYDLEIARLLDSNPQVEVFKKTTGDWADYDCIIGCPSQFLKDGEVLSYDVIGDQGEEYIATKAPRTTLGFKNDGTVVFMTIDGRQSSKEMDGVTLRENAKALINEGCSQGFNFDGGGSTTVAVLIDGEIQVTNSPSDGNIRRDSDYLLAAIPKTEMAYNVSCENGTITGSVDITPLNGFEYLDAEMYIDGKATGMSADNFTIANLAKGVSHNLSTYVKYQKGKLTVSKPFTSYNFMVEGEQGDATPTFDRYWIERNDNGFRLYLAFDDPDQLITCVKEKHGTVNGAVVKRLNDYYVNIVSTKDNSYSFEVSFIYRTSVDNFETVTLDAIPYEYKKVEEQETLKVSNVALNVDRLVDGTYHLTLAYDYLPLDATFTDALIYSQGKIIVELLSNEATVDEFEIDNETLEIVFHFECENCEEIKISKENIAYSFDDSKYQEAHSSTVDPDVPNPTDTEPTDKPAANSCSFGVKVILSMIALSTLGIVIFRKKN